MNVSIVTATFNRAVQLQRGMKSILRQEVLPEEIVIVDDGSTDNTAEIVQELQNFARRTEKCEIVYIYLDHPEHRISSIPRNVGIKNAKHDLVFFTEPECLHVGNTIAQLKQKFEEDPTHSHLASQVWTIQEKIYHKLEQDYFNRPEAILNHPYAQLTDNANLQNTKAPDSDWAITGERHCNAGCFFGVEKKALLDIGGFDEEFVGHGGDDFNLYDRLSVYGKGITKHEDIIVIHQWHEKNYPYNIYEMATHNLSLWHDKLKEGIYIANEGKEWGKL